MSCIIVGNGTSLLDAKNGSAIDSFDTVVRFNAYTTQEVEEFVGTRTDYWFNVIHFQSKDSEWRMKRSYKRVYIHSWEWSKEKDRLYQAFAKRFPPENLYKTEKKDVEEMIAFSQVEKYRAFSTGAIAIWILLRELESVTITGFDWWDRQEHHYNDRAIRGTNHKPHLEKMYIDKLVETGRVKFL